MTLISAIGLFTACALFAIIGVYCAYVAFNAARDAEQAEQRLVASHGRIIALEHAQDSLDAKHRKLAGRVYATERREPEPDPEESLPLEERNAAIRERLRAQHGLPTLGKPKNGATE
jgi:hypothetical protein